MPPPGYEPFLRAICENPEDDTVRLVYADWLDENGEEERAEFIRLQIAVPTRPEGYDERYARAEQLRKKNWAVWSTELPQIKGLSWGGFSRGFIVKATFSEPQYFQRGYAPMFDAAPIQVIQVRHIHPGAFRAFLTDPYLSRLRKFSAGIYLTDECIRALASDPRATALETLELTGDRRGPRGSGHISDVAAVALARSPHVGRLKHLALRGTFITDAGAAELRARFGDAITVDIPDRTESPDNPPP